MCRFGSQSIRTKQSSNTGAILGPNSISLRALGVLGKARYFPHKFNQYEYVAEALFLYANIQPRIIVLGDEKDTQSIWCGELEFAMKNLQWLTLPLILLASVTLINSSAHADGDKKSRLCRHLKMIYLLNGGSNPAAANEVKEKYGDLACGQISSGPDYNNNQGGSNTDSPLQNPPTVTADVVNPEPEPETQATDVLPTGP